MRIFIYVLLSLSLLSCQTKTSDDAQRQQNEFEKMKIFSGKVLVKNPSGIMVCLDQNSNYRCDENESSTQADGNGVFQFDIDQDQIDRYPLLAIFNGARYFYSDDVSSREIFYVAQAGGDGIVSPYTTVMHAVNLRYPQLSTTEQLELLYLRLSDQFEWEGKIFSDYSASSGDSSKNFQTFFGEILTALMLLTVNHVDENHESNIADLVSSNSNNHLIANLLLLEELESIAEGAHHRLNKLGDSGSHATALFNYLKKRMNIDQAAFFLRQKSSEVVSDSDSISVLQDHKHSLSSQLEGGYESALFNNRYELEHKEFKINQVEDRFDLLFDKKQFDVYSGEFASTNANSNMFRAISEDGTSSTISNTKISIENSDAGMLLKDIWSSRMIARKFNLSGVRARELLTHSGSIWQNSVPTDVAFSEGASAIEVLRVLTEDATLFEKRQYSFGESGPVNSCPETNNDCNRLERPHYSTESQYVVDIDEFLQHAEGKYYEFDLISGLRIRLQYDNDQTKREVVVSEYRPNAWFGIGSQFTIGTSFWIKENTSSNTIVKIPLNSSLKSSNKIPDAASHLVLAYHDGFYRSGFYYPKGAMLNQEPVWLLNQNAFETVMDAFVLPSSSLSEVADNALIQLNNENLEGTWALQFENSDIPFFGDYVVNLYVQFSNEAMTDEELQRFSISKRNYFSKHKKFTAFMETKDGARYRFPSVAIQSEDGTQFEAKFIMENFHSETFRFEFNTAGDGLTVKHGNSTAQLKKLAEKIDFDLWTQKVENPSYVNIKIPTSIEPAANVEGGMRCDIIGANQFNNRIYFFAYSKLFYYNKSSSSLQFMPIRENEKVIEPDIQFVGSDSGALWIADRYRIRKIDRQTGKVLQTTHLGSLGLLGNPDANLFYPLSINGYVYDGKHHWVGIEVANQRNIYVYKLDAPAENVVSQYDIGVYLESGGSLMNLYRLITGDAQVYFIGTIGGKSYMLEFGASSQEFLRTEENIFYISTLQKVNNQWWSPLYFSLVQLDDIDFKAQRNLNYAPDLDYRYYESPELKLEGENLVVYNYFDDEADGVVSCELLVSSFPSN